MSRYRVVITDNIFPDLEIESRMLNEVDADLVLVPNGGDLCAFVKDADVVVCTNAKITTDVVTSMQRCRLVVRTGVGVDAVDIEACTQRGIMVSNVPHYCSEEVAAHTMALLLSLARKIKALDVAVNNGRWGIEYAIPIYSLAEKRLGLIGFGKIARLVAEKARVFGMRVMACDPSASEEEMRAYSVEKADFWELIRGSDFVSLHCPLNPSTKGLINMGVFKAMEKRPFLINTARGAIIDEQDLVLALKNGLIAGAALDVLANNSPLQDDNSLLHMDNVIITPHVAWYSESSMTSRRVQAMENVIAVLQGGLPNPLCNESELAQRQAAGVDGR